jgi:curved DNA-binding protein CbpA
MAGGPMDSRLLPYTPERDVYRLLGIPATASTDEITAACRRLARTFHPDRNGSRRATEEMQVVNVVRQTLTDPTLRARYDRERWRFHADLTRAAAPAQRAWEPVHLVASAPAPWQRYARAAVVGIRSAVAALLPPRCRGCRTVVGADDAYCAACGTPRLTGG